MSGWVEAFIIIAAIAIVVQMAILVAMFVQMKVSLEQFTRIANDLQGRVDPILVRVNRILEDSEGRISSVMGDTAEITRLARGQAQKVDRVFTEALERLRIQVIRADQDLFDWGAGSGGRSGHEIPEYFVGADSPGFGGDEGDQGGARYVCAGSRIISRSGMRIRFRRMKSFLFDALVLVVILPQTQFLRFDFPAGLI